MSNKNVSTWMTPMPITIGSEENVIAAYEKMKSHHIRRLPVVDGGKLVGIITITDIRSVVPMGTGAILKYDDSIASTEVAQVMTSNPIIIAPEESVGEAARLIMKHKVSGLPVVENDALIGVISEADLFRLMIAESWRPLSVTKLGTESDEIITLMNGETIHVRPIRPDDAVRLQASHIKMSAETIYDRFMGFKNILPDEEARYLASLDYDRHMALVATTETNGEENILAVARYHVMDEASDSAEFAVVVSDLYQRRGLGTHLMKRLMEYAQAQGICTFIGFAHSGNMRLLRFVQRSGLPIERKLKDGVWEVRVNLNGEPFSEIELMEELREKSSQ